MDQVMGVAVADLDGLDTQAEFRRGVVLGCAEGLARDLDHDDTMREGESGTGAGPRPEPRAGHTLSEKRD